MHLTYLAALTGLFTGPLAPMVGVSAHNLVISHMSPGGIYPLTYTPGSNGARGTVQVGTSVPGGATVPGWMTYDPVDKTLYVLDENQGFPGYGVFGAMVTGWQIHTNNDSFGLMGAAHTDGGDVHGSVYGGPDGRSFVAMAGYYTSSITTLELPIDSGSRVLQKEHFTMSRPGPVKSRQDKPHPNAIFPDPTQRFLLVPDLGADVIRIFAVDPGFGTLNPCRPAKTGDGDGPRHGTFYQTAGNASTVLYVVNELSNTVSVWTLDYPPASDRDGCLSLTKTQVISTFAPGISAPSPNAKAAEVHVRDEHLYASNRNDQLFGSQQDSIAHYNIDPATGTLTWGESASAHAWCPTTFDINRNGTLVAVGGQATAKVVILERDPATGKLGPDAVAVSPMIGYGGRLMPWMG
ncbi:hypothetical protein PG984_005300 [Apiospora sp. TS-2023a]